MRELKKVNHDKFKGMKSKITFLTASVAFLLTASSFSFGPVDEVSFQDNALVQNEETQQKEKRVKVIVHKDGASTKIDTVFKGEAFPLADAKIDSMLKDLDLPGMDHPRDHMIIFDGRDRLIRHSRGIGPDSMVVMKLGSDSARRFIGKRIMHLEPGANRVIYIHKDSTGMMVPPVPPVPGPFPTIIHRQHRDHFSFDPTDENIISYDRKDIGKGLEKIVIVRKKVKDVKTVEEIDVEINDLDSAE